MADGQKNRGKGQRRRGKGKQHRQKIDAVQVVLSVETAHPW
jgi:hypothetical protein